MLNNFFIMRDREQTSALFWHVPSTEICGGGGGNRNRPGGLTQLVYLFKVGIGLGFPQDESIGFEPAQNKGIGFQNGHRFSMMIRVYMSH